MWIAVLLVTAAQISSDGAACTSGQFYQEPAPATVATSAPTTPPTEEELARRERVRQFEGRALVATRRHKERQDALDKLFPDPSEEALVVRGDKCVLTEAEVLESADVAEIRKKLIAPPWETSAVALGGVAGLLGAVVFATTGAFLGAGGGFIYSVTEGVLTFSLPSVTALLGRFITGAVIGAMLTLLLAAA
ncbi:MAG: hypothetical protein AB2A00_25700, partial [Myxococcota bacterium]